MSEIMQSASFGDSCSKSVGKNFKESPRFYGIITLKVFDRFGQLKQLLETTNLITNAGFAGLASRIGGAGAEAIFNYLAIGTGTTAANAADTTLQTEITDSGLARAAAAVTRVTTTVTNDTSQCVYTWTATGSKAVTEIGILNAAAGGVLLCRSVFAAVNVVNTDTLQATYKVKAA